MRFSVLRFVVFLVVVVMVAACGHSASSAGAVRGTDLRGIIDDQIRSHVRESYGELRGQNFSDEDLARFLAEKVPDQIVAQLKNSSQFLAAVEKVRAMSPEARAAYLQRCRLPLHKTWAELGAISPKGQTDAGQRAELAIAKAITDLAVKLLAGPPGAAVP
jgi:hypothetical protein